MKRAAILVALLLAAGCAQSAVISVREAPPAAPADFVLVDKSDRTLTLYSAGAPTMMVTGLQYGDAPEGHKRFQGDERTPEGDYVIDGANPRSAYHLSLRISYLPVPNATRATKTLALIE